MILNYISLPAFLISFALGLFVAYILGPEMKDVFVYPTPENVDTFLFQDHADHCFSFQANEVKCPNDPSLLSTIPVQN